MSSMRFNAQIYILYHGPTRRLKNAGVVADILTGIHNATVIFFFWPTGASYPSDYKCHHTQKFREFKSGLKHKRHAVVPPLYLSISHDTCY
jgi:hypothetical protein